MGGRHRRQRGCTKRPAQPPNPPQLTRSLSMARGRNTFITTFFQDVGEAADCINLTRAFAYSHFFKVCPFILAAYVFSDGSQHRAREARGYGKQCTGRAVNRPAQQ
jgi:hypothetical protein